MLSRTADHALRALLVLGRDGVDRPLPAETLAELTGTPANYLSKTLGALCRAGILVSTRGPAGGFALAVPASTITVAQIADVFAEPRPRRQCMLGLGLCNPEHPCAVHRHWTRVARATREPLANTTIADLLADAGPVDLTRHRPNTPADRATVAAASPSRNPVMSSLKHALAIAAVSVIALGGTYACSQAEAASRDASGLPIRTLPEITGVEKAVLTTAPDVPPPITRTHATKVIVELEAVEKTMRLADGVDYTFWTFGGQVPGNFIRVREGDLVELTLKNNAHSTVPHNIDLHAVTGPGGGAAATLTLPGADAKFTFRALNAGLYVYHCAMSPVPMHIGNGMYGLILVEPKEGLPKVDREFYLMQSEFYAKPGAPGAPYTLDMEKGAAEQPTHVVFNGSVGALTGDHALQAKTGETIRLFVGNGGPNLVSSFHVIGEIFDHVYGEGGTQVSQKNVGTTLIPAGGSAIVELRAEQAGDLILVDHSIFRAFNKGALAMLKVTGEKNQAVFAQLKGLPMAH